MKHEMTSGYKSKILYTGVTSNLMRRVQEHKEKLIEGWLGAKKIALINSMNPEWKDLSEAWFERK